MKFDLEFEKQDTLTKLDNLLNLADKIQPEHNGESYRGWHKIVVHFLKGSFTDNDVAKYFENEADMQVSYSYDEEPDDVYSYDLAKAKKALRLFKRELTTVGKPTEEKRSVESQFSSQIFIVHGHDEALKEKVSTVLRKLGLDPIVLNEKANQGMSILEKIEKHGNVGFAVVLFSSDDIGASKADHSAAKYDDRPRQNVLIELGYFWGKLGRDRVCLLNGIGDSLASDLKGLGYTSTQSGDSWKFELARELKAGGYNIDANALI